ncbi:hypothetical protein [Halobellus captivus]|uniref:hypothetical protein n=1 Tax=Halobellus captivus TaxID=2592614 RepID=UPI0011A2998B|nr:hypothetical protein [Halobellus captivus]
MPHTAREWVAWLSPGMMILVGAVLFFIPAPPTSLIGIALIIVGAVLWLVDYFGRDEPDEREAMRGGMGNEDPEPDLD